MFLLPKNEKHSKYVVVGPFGTCWHFQSPHDVAIFMWGKDCKRYSVYTTLEPLPVEISEMEKRIHHLVDKLETVDGESTKVSS